MNTWSESPTMNVLILGNGSEELAWAKWLMDQVEHRLDAAFPGFADPALAGVAAPTDLDDALARAGIDAVIVGGPLDFRGEALRRAAAEGLAVICLHPPGPDSEAYYQVSLSREETGAVIVPDLPLRLHPGIAALRQAWCQGELGTLRGLRLEWPAATAGTDLAREAVPRAVDVVRALLGEIEALTATGDPPGEHPDIELLVQLRAIDSRRAELRTWPGPGEPARLTLLGAEGSLALEFDRSFDQPARLIGRTSSRSEPITELEPWDPHAAIVSVLSSSMGRRSESPFPGPNLLDGTRAMELAEATLRSLRRGRTIELHYEPISEEANFKSIMTSTGCLIFLGSLFALPLALAGPPLGWNWTIYIAYLIPPVLAIFVTMQTLRLAVRRPIAGDDSSRGTTLPKPSGPRDT
jgi:myo-inositol 2-dehydrogenase/D-chiro-inositol 1-dehydrogenase